MKQVACARLRAASLYLPWVRSICKGSNLAAVSSSFFIAAFLKNPQHTGAWDSDEAIPSQDQVNPTPLS